MDNLYTIHDETNNAKIRNIDRIAKVFDVSLHVFLAVDMSWSINISRGITVEPVWSVDLELQSESCLTSDIVISCTLFYYVFHEAICSAICTNGCWITRRTTDQRVQAITGTRGGRGHPRVRGAVCRARPVPVRAGRDQRVPGVGVALASAAGRGARWAGGARRDRAAPCTCVARRARPCWPRCAPCMGTGIAYRTPFCSGRAWAATAWWGGARRGAWPRWKARGLRWSPWCRCSRRGRMVRIWSVLGGPNGHFWALLTIALKRPERGKPLVRP